MKILKTYLQGLFSVKDVQAEVVGVVLSGSPAFPTISIRPQTLFQPYFFYPDRSQHPSPLPLVAHQLHSTKNTLRLHLAAKDK